MKPHRNDRRQSPDRLLRGPKPKWRTWAEVCEKMEVDPDLLARHSSWFLRSGYLSRQWCREPIGTTGQRRKSELESDYTNWRWRICKVTHWPEVLEKIKANETERLLNFSMPDYFVF